MISDAELLAGLAFLEKYAHQDFGDALRTAKTACVTVLANRRKDELRALPAGRLELSVRSANTIASLGFKTVGEVEAFVAMPDAHIFERGKRFGFQKKCMKELRALMKEIGL
jgi:hypothetical protein